MTDNTFETGYFNGDFRVKINDDVYHVTDSTAAIVHALLCIDATLEDGMDKIARRLEFISIEPNE